jgi:hypothetical protein
MGTGNCLASGLPADLSAMLYLWAELSASRLAEGGQAGTKADLLASVRAQVTSIMEEHKKVYSY